MIAFKKKLKALDYEDWDKVNTSDTNELRNLIVWLEDQKIRYYKVEDRDFLRDIESEKWPQSFDRYCKDVGCPITTIMPDKVEWFLGQAIRYDYEDNQKVYQEFLSKKAKKKNEIAAPTVKSTNPLDNLNFDSKEFKEGVSSLAKLLSIQEHPDHLVTLEACSKFVRKKLSPTVVQNPSAFIPKGKPFPVLDFKYGSDLGDPLLNKAVKILNLLYIQDLRDLQTKINEAIVSVQTITANPKTDTKLGKVGF
ncbi:RNA transcription, translation and transport factor protein isoform X2 [Belonocnema kinseyi]|uniref:RNA transcription, translation and transport factor protein isoform X2 n=1 Tax=Belonocnema kinseyi TaxID=2817044 RepID=UPI00143D7766|nr:RNA transcription, translation and transport factor protein isoform X2 [Belonocnema kinseyi]